MLVFWVWLGSINYLVLNGEGFSLKSCLKICSFLSFWCNRDHVIAGAGKRAHEVLGSVLRLRAKQHLKMS